MLQILPSILTPHSLTFLSNFPFEGSRGNDSFLIERRHTHVKDLKHLSDIMTSIEADTDIALVIRTREVFETSSNKNTKILSNY